MKFIHLSDLHLGKRIHGFSMLEDQKYILEQIIQIVKQEQADGVLLAGDLYDKPVPPIEAVQELDRFLTGLASLGISVFAVSGNHDSAERIAFGARLMQERDIYLSPAYDGSTAKICVEDEYGEVWIHLLPYVKPAAVRHAYPQEDIQTYQDAVQAAVRHMEVDTDKRNILVAHQFVTGAWTCDSEEISVGGVDNVEASVFDEFDYVALGHIHSPQKVGRPQVRYCGTPLKYSFSEADQEKSLTVVQIGEKGSVQLHTIPLKPLRDMRKIRGSYLEVTARSFYQGMKLDDYYQITLTDEEDIPDGLQRLRTIYGNLMRLEYDNQRTREDQEIDRAEEIEKKSELELFEEFYQLQNNQPMSDQQRELARKLAEEIREGEERES
ncbi:Nuclease sbcCD subunit D [Blautia hydrogenotrophica]|uniref:exonuclease SbcCD subunit D n=1 Tax=Blautia hydrogenotrophica TaxID=53443 RepID=UPI0006C5CB06|nr:exonuclease SbcCD subunit D [Blautia hydrogenotrophica]CUN11284.1 Nuclease sbcCD subunit D [Blautia hydrogenotrophica]SCH69886.1 Nuclease sbcCD subunit D [uncultured Blautia sp.]